MQSERVRSSSDTNVPGSPTEGGEKKELYLKTTQSGKHVVTDQNQFIFKTSSLALLRAKHGLSPRSSSVDNSYMSGAKRVLDFMYNLWQKKRLCDVTITTAERQTLHAHKIALGAYSSSMAERFYQQDPETICHIDVPIFNTKTISSILRFIYTTELELSDRNVDPVLGCALDMGVELVVMICKEYLSNFNVDTALLYHSIAEKYDLVDLESSIYDFICEKFSAIANSRSFLTAPLKSLSRLADEDRLNVASELDVFLAVVAWIDYNRQERVVYAPGLVGSIRMQLMTPEVLVTRVEVVEHVFCLPQCQAQLYNAVKYHALRHSGSRLADSFPVQVPRARGQQFRAQAPVSRTVNDASASPPAPTRASPEGASPTKVKQEPLPVEISPVYENLAPALPTRALAPPASRYVAPPSGRYRSKLVVVSVGGLDLQNPDEDTPGKSLFWLDSPRGHWEALSRLHHYTHHHGVIALGDVIYVIGGAVYNTDDPQHLGGATRATYSFNCGTRSWRRLADLRTARAYLAVAAEDGAIYAIGGEDENRRKLDSVERYDVASNHWSLVSRMPGGAKIGMSAAVWRDALYIVGGYNRERTGNPVLRDVECFDLRKQKWIPKQPLPIPRCHANLVTAGDRLFLACGRTRLEGPPQTVASLSAVDVYDDQSDTWSRVTDLQQGRHDAGCAVVDSKIYIVGGMRTPSPYCLSSVECYDVTSGCWEEHASSLPYRTSGVACCALEMAS